MNIHRVIRIKFNHLVKQVAAVLRVKGRIAATYRIRLDRAPDTPHTLQLAKICPQIVNVNGKCRFVDR